MSKRKPPLTLPEARTAIAKAIREGRVEFSSPHAEEAFASLRMEPDNPEYGLFIDVSLEPWKAKGTSGVTIRWAVKGVGFGEVTLSLKGQKWSADTEGMSKQFIIDALTWFVKNKLEVE